MELKYFIKNNKICPVSEAVISLFNIEHNYGFGVYENIKIKNSKPCFLDEHITRLFSSASLVRMEHGFSKTDISKSINQLIQKLSDQKININLKMVLMGAKQKKDTTLYILPLNPHFIDRKLYRDGVKTLTKKYERWMPQAKTLNMLPSYVYYSEAKNQGCYDVLFVDKQNNVIEGSRTNFFVIDGKTIVTAPEEEVLNGVTRRYVIEIARKNNYTVKEEMIKLEDLEGYKSAFLTSTSSRIVPINKIDDIEFGKPSKELVELMGKFDEYLKEQEAE
ncbi:MAG: aminotransferase class IV [Candidatus Micrarchaeota archaeon]